MSGEGEHYNCAVCHGHFIKTWSDEEALAERKATWQPSPDDVHGDDIVCDDCYRQVMAWAESEHPEFLRS